MKPYADGEPIRVWPSEWILQGIIVKATQPDDPRLHAEQRGLGWSHDKAMRLLTVVWMFLDQTGGGLYTRGGMNCY